LEISPNPSCGIITISYKIMVPGPVNIGIFDVSGNEVFRIINEYLQDGFYKVQFDLKNLPGSFYLIRLNSEEYTETKKLISMSM
jgi:hypothetical protein